MTSPSAGEPLCHNNLKRKSGNISLTPTPSLAAEGPNADAVHPRARGEHVRVATQASVFSGSSPRTRGTRSLRVPAGTMYRFIPAHAGNTLPWPCALISNSVHPRARGEHFFFLALFLLAVGSSPRTRGTLLQHPPKISDRRFIPAHAGNTAGWAGCRSVEAVHPRARGEHLRPERRPYPLGGSSPRTRGTLRFRLCHCLYIRFIPAHAGNTINGQRFWIYFTVHPRAR